MKIVERLNTSKKLLDDINLPWDVMRVFPDMDFLVGNIGDPQVCFSPEGDYVSIEEAITALKYMLNQLKDIDDSEEE